MTATTTPESSSDTPSPPLPPPSSHSQRGCWAAHIGGVLAIAVVGIPIGQTLPELLRHMEANGDWKPFGVAMVPLAMLLYPVDFWGMVRGLAPSLLRRPEK